MYEGKGRGFIAGTNERSVLIGIYHYLAEAGRRWVRHCVGGEFIPIKDIYDVSVKICERASYRHRGICIEGAKAMEMQQIRRHRIWHHEEPV